MTDDPRTIWSLIEDRSLPDASRVLGAFIALRDQGEGIELRFDAIAHILHGFPGKDKIRGSIRPLEALGYIARRAGGAMHGDTFFWRGEPIEWGSDPTLRESLSELQGGQGQTVRPQTHPIEWGQGHTVGPQPHPTSRARAGPPPHTSDLSPPLDARAREFVLESESLRGCRDSLLDYLGERVEPDRQLAYVQTVVGMIEGTDERLWKGRNGRDRITENRPKIVAGCLNELRQGDEVGKYFPDPPGGVRNLQSKIRYKVKAETDAKRDAERRSEGPGAPGAAGSQPKDRARATPEVNVER